VIAKHTATNNSHNYSDSSVSSISAVSNSAMVSTVATPNFIQALYGSAANPSSLSEKEEQSQLAIATTSPRKAVTSLAAVQLPQFPPLPRR
jgi:hypothetical protein